MLLLVFFFCKFLEGVQGLVPQTGEVVAQQCNPLRVELVNATRSHLAIAYQPRFLQYTQVLRYGGARYRQSRGEFLDRMRVLSQLMKDGQASWIAKRSESVLYVSIHLP